MIDQYDRRLVEWVQSVLPATSVTFTTPVRDMPSGVNVYLLELGASSPPRGPERTPVQFSLRYMVTTWAEDVFEAHRILGELLSAAMQQTDFEVSFDVSGINWDLFGVAPRPAFIVTLAVRVQLPEPSTPRVRQPLVLKAETATQLAGRVLGPGNVPIAGAHVWLAASDLSVRTDADGRFVVPIGARPLSLRVTANGKSQSVTAERPADGNALTIRFGPAEV